MSKPSTSRTLTVQSTVNYDLFKTIKGNRDVHPGHDKKLEKSLSENNLMPFIPLLVSKDGYIVDGQHRLQAAKNLQMPIYYLTLPGGNIEYVHMLNSYTRPWVAIDYVRCFAMQGNKDYQIILDMVDKHHLPVTTTAELLYGKELYVREVVKGKRVSTRSVLTSGEFKAKNIANASAFMEKFTQVVPFIEGRPTKNRDFISALKKFYDMGADNTILTDHLKRSPKLPRQPDVTRWLLILADTYNMNISKAKHIHPLPTA